MTQDATRPEIRAHMATWPPRRGILPRAVERLLPQVDKLFLCLNLYDAVPREFADHPKIEAVIPPRDLRDAGKFFFRPPPDARVFLVDDDLGYPPDYVAHTLAEADRLGWEGKAFGYLGFTWPAPGVQPQRWQLDFIRLPLAEAKGADMLGTGTVALRGDMLAPLDQVEPFHGAVDVGMALWLRRMRRLMWTLPRRGDWLTNDLPKELLSTSIHMTDSRNPRPEVTQVVRQLIMNPPPNRGMLHSAFAAARE